MTKKEFKKLLDRNHPVYLDGATGSNLIKRGMPSGVCPEQWILKNPGVLVTLQKEYVKAGSDILYAPTFTCNRIKLREYGLENQVREMNRDLVALSREASGGKALTAGDLTMTGEQLFPMGDMEFEELIDVYKEQILSLAEAGADLLAVETMMSLQETRAALIAAKETCDLPVMVTMTFEADARTLYGTDAATAVNVLQHLGADAVGANCSTGPDKMVEIIQEMKKYAFIPIISKPNAGMPSLAADGQTIYDMNAAEFGREMAKIVEAGAAILGGCCGTTPQYIEELVKNTGKLPVKPPNPRYARCLSSEQRTVTFEQGEGFRIVGERINPTGKKALQAELKEGRFDLVRSFASQQEQGGASILDVNMGMSGADEKTLMLKAIDAVSQTVSLPLAIDSSHEDIMEAALRKYPGRALINSISMETAKMHKLLSTAKKYGAMFILLPLSDQGLPKSAEEKRQIIRTVLKEALKAGLQKEDIVVDGLVTTAGANKNAALETLETIRYCSGELGLSTIVGLSNISFGLPGRSYVNSAFLTMAILSGLTMAIANPCQELTVSSALAADLLLNKDGADIRYIVQQEEAEKGKDAVREKNTTKAAVNKAAEETVPGAKEKAEGAGLPEIYESVLKGNREKIVSQVKTALEAGAKPQELLNVCLLPAIGEVGDLFDKGRYFLPQLIAGAESMKRAVEYLEPLMLEENAGEKKPVIVIATVAGDIHDIGKNLVALMLKNYGFQVIDLGKDVPREEIVRAAKDNGASIIALSALMTTTMREMPHVIEHARKEGVNAKIIIGGAVITQEYADEIGADGYSSDAADAVRLAQRILGL